MTELAAADGAEDTPATGAVIKVCPDGPLLVRGDFSLVDADGNVLQRPDAPSLALCRCGKSLLKPLCDGTHKTARFKG